MDGSKARLSDSLQRRLSIRLSLAILIIGIFTGTFCFVSAFHEAHEFQDEVLHQVAYLLDIQEVMKAPMQPSLTGDDSSRESHVFVLRLVAPQSTSSKDMRQPDFSTALQDGLQTIDVPQGSFRVYVRTLHSGERFAIAQRTEARDEIAFHSAMATLMPLLLLVPLLLLMATDLVRKMLRPIAQLSQDVDRRSERELHAFDTHAVPSEIRPFVVAINRLLGRVSHAMQGQHRFIADAAHELRTPMTALSLQAERLADAEMSTEARKRLLPLRQGIERGRALLEQLLTLARAQSVVTQAQGMVSVHRAFRRVLEDLLPMAEAKEINIGIASETDVSVCANETDLCTLLRNLVDNAIRYTPAGGQVDLAMRAEPDSVVIEITDTGPGIAPSERVHVFAPFYRVVGTQGMGSGLGLSIVASVAERSGAIVTLEYAEKQIRSGLCVIVRYPKAPMVEREPVKAAVGTARGQQHPKRKG